MSTRPAIWMALTWAVAVDVMELLPRVTLLVELMLPDVDQARAGGGGDARQRRGPGHVVERDVR